MPRGSPERSIQVTLVKWLRLVLPAGSWQTHRGAI